MKLLRLHIAAYGHFTGFTLDFSDRSKSLHVIYGPNEAGKTTVKGAIEDWLFRIPGQSRFGFLHGNATLSIQGSIDKGNGETLSFERRKKNKDDLRTLGGEPLLESALAPFLSGLQRDGFRTQFSLTREDLARGSQEMLEGKGELGASLYGAALGNATFMGIVENLDKQIADIFKPAGRARRMNAALDAHSKARTALREADIRPNQWYETRRELDGVEKAVREIDTKLGQFASDIGLLERLGAQAGAYQRCNRLRAELAIRATETHIPADVADECRKLAEARQSLFTKLAEYEDEAARLEQAVVHPAGIALREHAAAIQGLHAGIGRYTDGKRDLGRTRQFALKWAGEASQHLARVWNNLELESARQRNPPTEQRSRANELVVEFARHTANRATVSKTMQQLEAVIAEKDLEAQGLPPARDVRALPAAIATATAEGRVDEAVAEASTSAARKTKAAHTKLHALGLFTGDLAALQQAVLPTAKTVTVFKRAFDDCDAEAKTAKQRRDDLLAEVMSAERKLEEYKQRGVVSAAELETLRSERDGIFDSLSEQWHAAASVAQLDETAARYRPAVQQADATADDLRENAEHVTIIEQTVQRRDETRRAASDQEAILESRAVAREKTQTEWSQAWADLGIVPKSPDEMSAWLQQADSVRQLASELDDAVFAVAEATERRAGVCKILRGALTGLDVVSPFVGEELQPLLSIATDTLAQLEATETTRMQLVRDGARDRKELTRQRRALQSAQMQLAESQAAWEETMTALWLPKDLAPATLADMLRTIDLFRENDAKAEVDRVRADGMERDMTQFVRAVKTFATQAAPDLLKDATTAPDAVVEILNERLQAARDAYAAEQARLKRLDEVRTQMERDGNKRAEAEAALTQVARRFSIEPASVFEVVTRSEETRAMQREFGQTRSDVQDGTRKTLKECDAEYQGRDQSEIDSALELARHQQKDIVSEREAVIAQRSTLAKMFADMDTSQAALDAEAELLARGAEIDADARRWAELTIAREVLNQQVKEYLEKHQGPLIERSQHYFRELTGGVFTRLRVLNREGESPELEVVGRNGSETPLEGLSGGTRDQLYLALRLASLDEYMKVNVPQPFILDDTFVQFDDERTELAFKTLADFSKHTQVIYFTHHRKCAEAAVSASPPEMLAVYELPPRWPPALVE